MKFKGECVERVEVLRRRGCFALRSGYSAQDDNVQNWMP
jgi:hypothetical protein